MLTFYLIASNLALLGYYITFEARRWNMQTAPRVVAK